MRFTAQQIDGRAVLLAEGAIDDAMFPRLREALRTFRGQEIWLRSPGGSARAADQAGYLIRERGFSTHIPAGWACSSACAFMFMGGVHRIVDRGGLLIMTMFTLTPSPNARGESTRGSGSTDVIGDIALASALRATEENNFLIRMGISRRLPTEIAYLPSPGADARHPATRRCLTPEEERRYNLVTESGPPGPAN